MTICSSPLNGWEKEIITLRGMVRQAMADPEIRCTVIKRHFLRGVGASHRIIVFGVGEHAAALRRPAPVLLPLARSMRIQGDLADRFSTPTKNGRREFSC
jgi:hypothetical protein